MSLPNELISQFVKITKDDKKAKSETTVYGTTVSYNGGIYVKLDGSDLLTPITTTADTLPGERVMVLIKNHHATVTGNISSPSARANDVQEIGDGVDQLGNQISEFEIVLADKVDTKDFVAEKARIDTLNTEVANIKELIVEDGEFENLTADIATITEKLTAAEADIEDLNATKLDADIAVSTYATIKNLNATNADLHNLEATYGDFEVLATNKFAAVEGDIADLQASKLDATTANITYAKITDLKATNADVTNLEADVADVNTLLFGSATGDVIQTSFANAVIAQLGDAQIKSAMIDSVSADKITAGDIITNNVRVKSQNGLLLISDETIQISDDNRVRVQIGKDAANDYSINIWDESGKLMFSKGGITDSAIKEAIIRNDMVSDNANIAAHKLDIDSLFEEINGSTNTIKSTKVYLDDEAQTLDVAFTAMSTSVENAQSTADRAQATANQNASDMAQLITDFNSDVENLQTQIDGSITTWFYEVIPTNNNEPAVNWTTTELKNNHLGDLYYDTITGYCYRYQVQNNAYSWQRITDTDVTKALADASAAKDTADQKRRVFYSQPSTPYDVGDLWVQGSDGDILRCQIAKTSSQSYATSDWVLASKYTDDTTAEAAQAAADQNAADIASVSKTVTSQGTAISVLQGQIEAKIWEQDIETAKSDIGETTDTLSTQYEALEADLESVSATVASHTSQISTMADSSTVTEVSNKVASLETSLDGFESTVSETYATKTEVVETVDNIQVGGRNLIQNSDVWSSSGTTSTGITASREDGVLKVVVEATNSNWHSFIRTNTIENNLNEGDEFTFSIEIKSEDGSKIPKIYFKSGLGYYAMTGKLGIEYATVYYSGKWKKNNAIQFHFGWSGCSGTYYIRKIKFEKGNKATDWTPAPEDIETEIDDLTSRVTTAETSITQNTEAIELRATKTEVSTAKTEAISSANENTSTLLQNYSTTTEMNSAIEAKADSITSSVSATYATIESVESIEIGGRNLVATSYLTESSWGIGFSGTSTKEFTAKSWVGNAINSARLKKVFESGESYTIHCDIEIIELPEYTANGIYDSNIAFYVYSPSTTYDKMLPAKIVEGEKGALGAKYVINETFVFPEIQDDTYLAMYTCLYKNSSGGAGTATKVKVTNFKIEKGTKATDWTPAPEDVQSDIDAAQAAANAAQATANQNAADMASIVTDFSTDVQNLQTQIDGSITTWFYEVAPSTSNEPAVNWFTTDLKNTHLGDLYYDTITGYCYRWQVSNNIYSWQRITDTDVTKALSDAQTAQDTADQKRRVFYVQPTSPYDAGDLWVQGSNGDILRCQTAKTTGQSFASSDWIAASKYTDDTAATTANSNALTAQSAAASAQTTANAAYKNAVRKSGTIDLTSSEYDEDTYYPVVGKMLPFDGYRYVSVNVQLNSGSVPSWSTHDSGFTCNITVRMKACGWGTVNYSTLGWIDDFSYNFCDKMPAYINQNRNTSKPVLYLRGGGKYFVYTDYDSTWTAYTDDITESNITFSPTESPTNHANLVNNWQTITRVTNAETRITQTESSITSLATRTTETEGRIETAESTIEQLSDKVTTNVTEISNLGTKTTTLEQTANGLTARITTAEGSISTAQSTANTALARTTLTDTRSTNQSPSWYITTYPKQRIIEFKSCSAIGLSGATYCTLETIVPWNDKSGGYPKQIATVGAKQYWRVGTSDSVWGDWMAASETATNYLNFSSDGLVVGDHTADTLGKNVLIDSDSVDIRNGETVLASFGANTVTLGQNSADSVIDLCDGAGTIKAFISEADDSYPQYDSIEIDSQWIEMNSNTTRLYAKNATQTSYVNDAHMQLTNNKSSAGSFAGLSGNCTEVSTTNETSAGISAAAYEDEYSTKAQIYASFKDNANSASYYNYMAMYPKYTEFSKAIKIGSSRTEFTGENKVLWSGAYYMNSDQTATLSEAISAQANGIVLVWSWYADGAADNSNFNSFFIPKHFVSAHNGRGVAMFLTNATMNVVCSKYVYVLQSNLNGYSGNNATEATKSSGITSTPRNFVLRYVIGV